jgi:hypothetical protein
MFQTIQDRQDSLQQQLLQDRAESRAFMTLMLQRSGVSIPSVQSAPPPPLQAPVVPAIQSGPPLPSVGPSSSPLRPVTLAFTSPVLSSVCPQPPVPPASAVTTTAVAVSVTTSDPAAHAAQPQSESYQLQLLQQILDPRLTLTPSWHSLYCLDRDRMRPRHLLPLLMYRFGYPFGV